MEYCTGLFESEPLSEFPWLIKLVLLLLLFSRPLITFGPRTSSRAGKKTNKFRMARRNGYLADNPTWADSPTASSPSSKWCTGCRSPCTALAPSPTPTSVSWGLVLLWSSAKARQVCLKQTWRPMGTYQSVDFGLVRQKRLPVPLLVLDERLDVHVEGVAALGLRRLRGQFAALEQQS